ncbi:24592_t:CDS:1, partial [Gigaspora rosea]
CTLQKHHTVFEFSVNNFVSKGVSITSRLCAHCNENNMNKNEQVESD